MTLEPSSPPPSTRPGRSCLGCVVTSSLGCSGLVIGSLGAVLLFAPTMLGRPLAGVVESMLDSSVQGGIKVDNVDFGVDFGWSRSLTLQGLSVLGEDGALIAKLDLVLPPLGVIWDEEATEWDMTASVESLDLVLGEDGSTNLERALAPSSKESSTPVKLGAFESDGDLLGSVDYSVFLTMGTNAWSLSVENSSRPFQVQGGAGSIRRRGEDMAIDFLRDGQDVSLEVQMAWSGDSVPEGMVRARPVPVEMIGQALNFDGDLGLCIGDQVTLELDLVDRGVQAYVEGTQGRHFRLDGEVAVEEGATTIHGGAGGLTGQIIFPPTLLPIGDTRLLKDTRLSFESEAWTVSTEDHWSVQLVESESAEVSGSFELSRAEPLFILRATAGEERELHTLRGPRLGFSRGPSGVRGSLEALHGPSVSAGEEAGHIGIRWQRDTGESLWLWDVTVEQLDTTVLAEIFGLEGDALGVYAPVARLGSEIDMKLDGTMQGGTIEIASSSGAPYTATMNAHFEQGWFRGREGDVMRIPLDPSSEHDRIWLADLLPWYESLTKPEGSGPIWIRLTDFDIPLAWDVAKFDATAELDLGEVRYEPTESFASLFALDDAAAGVETFGTVQVDLDGETIRYGDGLEIAIGGELFPFTGSHDLRNDQLNLSGEVLGVFVLGSSRADLGLVEIPVTINGPVDGLKLGIELNSIRAGLTQKFNSLLDLLGKEDD